MPLLLMTFYALKRANSGRSGFETASYAGRDAVETADAKL